MRQLSLAAAALIALAVASTLAQAPNPWAQPAAALAGKIAALLGPGQANLTVRNLSSIPASEVPAITQLLTDDLRVRGVIAAGADSASTLRVTLSESAQERLWVAEVMEGTDSRVAMIDAGPLSSSSAQAAGEITLHRERVFSAREPVLAVLESNGWLIAVEPETLLLFGRRGNAWMEDGHVDFLQQRGLSRDPRAVIRLTPATPDGGFEVFTGKAKCTGNIGITYPAGQWQASCSESDDPWPVTAEIRARTAADGAAEQIVTPPAFAQPVATQPVSAQPIRAFYNAARDYFTGVIVPGPAVELPAFYSAALIPRPESAGALLIGGIDGKVQLLDGNVLSPVDGARDWGSDFAALHSGCGPQSQKATQIVTSGSGEARSDSLRAYNLPGLEAIPTSAPLPVDGTVTALWTTPGGQSILAVVRSAQNQYEVDRVTASCN